MPNFVYYQHEMRYTFDRLINDQARALTLSPAQLDRVYKTCNEIAQWFRQGDLKERYPRIYTQGSIRLETSITPKLGGGFDADLVVELRPGETWQSRPRDLFETVGNHLKAMPGFTGQIREKRRCWALIYDSEYHIDITPAILDAAKGGSAILVFDGLSQSWRSSDPLGYAAWFFQRAALTASRDGFGVSSDNFWRADPLAGSDWLRVDHQSHPLARAVQLLKRRRDLWFAPEEAPNSMVLTTLAGRFYEGEGTVSETLLNMVQRISDHFSDAGERRIVVNPINDVEVLSESWVSNPVLAQAFTAFITEMRVLLLNAGSADRELEMTTRVDRLFCSS